MMRGENVETHPEVCGEPQRRVDAGPPMDYKFMCPSRRGASYLRGVVRRSRRRRPHERPLTTLLSRRHPASCAVAEPTSSRTEYPDFDFHCDVCRERFQRNRASIRNRSTIHRRTRRGGSIATTRSRKLSDAGEARAGGKQISAAVFRRRQSHAGWFARTDEMGRRRAAADGYHGFYKEPVTWIERRRARALKRSRRSSPAHADSTPDLPRDLEPRSARSRWCDGVSVFQNMLTAEHQRTAGVCSIGAAVRLRGRGARCGTARPRRTCSRHELLSPAPRQSVCYRAPRRWTIDGRLDEPSWQAARWWIRCSTSKVPAAQPRFCTR